MTGDELRARRNAVDADGVRLGWIAVTEAERDAMAHPECVAELDAFLDQEKAQ